jgi:hypothetical protein
MSRGLLQSSSTVRVSRLFARGFFSTFWLLLAAVILFLVPLQAQQLTATLNGTAYDQSGAVVPNAQVVVKNQASGDTRTTTANNDGYFTVTALQPGTYDVTVTATGFQGWEQKNVVLNLGDNRTLPNIALKVGQTSQAVEVVSGAEAVAPVDTGEVSTTLNEHMVNDIALQGRDAGELLKIMPGMALASADNFNASGFQDRVVGTNTGPIGSYSANGTQPNGAMAYMLDGANLVDPGNQGTQIANINQDMTAEVKYLASGYDAEYAKGPIIFQAFSKSGGSSFHGEGYFYARNGIFNSEDAYLKSQGQPKPPEYEYYPGGNIGGPVLIPWTHFNRNHDKLFFWFGYEYMDQHPAGQLWSAFVPTPQMRAGDFSQATLNSTVPSSFTGISSQPCPAASTGLPRSSGCGNLTFVNGQIPVGAMDPNSLALLKLYPMPNVDPATHNGANFEYLDQSPTNRWEQTEKVDYSITENTKLTVSYARQDEQDIHPVQVWWAPSWELPYPSPMVAPTTADVVMSNLTHVFSPTLTNETVFTYARYINPVSPATPADINPSTYGFDVPGLFGAKRVQIPNLISWGTGGNGFSGFDQQAVFGGGFNGGAFGALKSVPAVYDNLSKVVGTHTMKFGFYWDSNGNQQSSGNVLNGSYDFETYGGTSTGNVWADFLLGRAANYQQASAIPVDNLYFHQYSLYGQDSWKISKRLTINYGVRFDHIGQWYDNYGGIAVFNLAAYASNPTAVNAGLEWNKIDSNIPTSGWKSPLFYYDPRAGFAYDVFGNGKTVVRAGFGIFRYQIAYNTIQVPSEEPLGVATVTVPSSGGLTSLAQITKFNPSTATNAACGNSCSIQALAMGDGKTPYTIDYNFTIDQGLPGHALWEVSYVGNKSRDLLTAGTNSDPNNINMQPLGSYFGIDPVTGKYNNPELGGFPTNDYRPFQSYGDMWIAAHSSYANYNSLQTSLQKQSGPATFLLNYTFSKVLGIRDGVSQNGTAAGALSDPFNVNANYGVLAFDHTHIFNTAYVLNLPSPMHGNKLASGVINGWQLSGVITLQSGAPLQPGSNGGNLNAQYGNVLVTGPNGQPLLSSSGGLQYAGISPQTWLGSSATGLTLQPLLTCDPRSGLKSGQYFNPSCFTIPAQGQQGDIIWPYIRGPAFFDTDLGIFKTFHITERQSLQFRFSAFNFVNHPLPSFATTSNDNTDVDMTLNFGTGGTTNLAARTNQNVKATGFPLYALGNRLCEFAVKYYF